MTSKTIAFRTPPVAARTAEEWVQPQPPSPPAKTAPATPTKRLTVDIVEDTHRRLKLDAVQRGLQISDIVRQLLDERYPAADATSSV